MNEMDLPAVYLGYAVPLECESLCRQVLYYFVYYVLREILSL